MRAQSNAPLTPQSNRPVVWQVAAAAVLTSAISVFAMPTLANPMTPNAIAGFDNAIAEAQPVALVGTFIAAEAPTTGTARIVTEAGHRYLELDAAFSTTDQAPDLHVLIETAQTPPSSYTTLGSAVNLGSLQQASGAQRYPIPDVIDVAEFKSVVIWCRMANATMGYAVLGGDRSATVQ
jgi:Electron transfer DM13